ncbi:uncharacterized protein LOC135135881 [Zophobas morio]|uniref:uncharacterized protein LOC135135881 n=1 Tax=Zophobas morio TaxID=2755281 RepID=UPI0030838BED
MSWWAAREAISLMELKRATGANVSVPSDLYLFLRTMRLPTTLSRCGRSTKAKVSFLMMDVSSATMARRHSSASGPLSAFFIATSDTKLCSMASTMLAPGFGTVRNCFLGRPRQPVLTILGRPGALARSALLSSSMMSRSSSSSAVVTSRSDLSFDSPSA